MTVVDEIKITPVRVPLEQPVSAAGKTFHYRDYLLVDLLCRDGSRGIGFSYVGTGGGRAAAITAEELLVPEVVGRNPSSATDIWNRMYRATLIQGRAGLVMNGLSAIDIAIWDRNSRAANMPLFLFLGGSDRDDTVPAYASGGYYADGKGPEELAAEISGYKEQGFKAFKIKTGCLSVQEEERRIRAVREVIGEDAVLILDLYSSMHHLSEVLPYINMYRQYNPYWIEDPFLPDDLDSFARLAARIQEPIAIGEFHYCLAQFKQIIETGAGVIIQAEAPRCGGITEWQRIAAFASAHGAAMSPCWFHQLHVHLLPGITNGLYVEYFSGTSVLNFDQLIDTHANIRDGAVELPNGIGVGFEFVPEQIQAYSLNQ